MSIFTTQEIVEKIKGEHALSFRNFEKRLDRKAILGIVRIGENKVSDSYVRIKKRYAETVGVEVREVWIDENLSQEEVESKVEEVVSGCDGVIVQLPIPQKFDTPRVVSCVTDDKDIDQLNLQTESKFMQPVVFSIVKILDFLQVNLSDKNIVVLGQGRLVGKPFSQYLDRVTISHLKLNKEKTELEIREGIKSADFLVTGIGVAGYVKPDMVKQGSVIIDAGTSEDGDTIAGDVEREVGEVASVLVTTPGGVGPLTVCGLFENLKIACQQNLQKTKYRYIDCHSHPHDEKYQKDESFLEILKNDGGATIAIGTDYENSLQAINLAKKNDNIWSTIGIHPADNHLEIFDENKFEELLRLGGSKVVGVGECGLDYFYFDKNYSGLDDLEKAQKIKKEKDRQRELFIKQVEFAKKYDLPLVIHGRPSKNSMDAYRDIVKILKEYKNLNSNLRGHAHFFVGNLEIAKEFLDLGFLLSFDGPITFTTEYDEVIKNTPLESIMIETDAPYAAPVPCRGQINYPHYVVEIAKKIAMLKNETTEKVLEITKQNAGKLFQISL